MNKRLIIFTILLAFVMPDVFPQEAQDTSVFLITCGPGTETYSIYGHSALHIVINSTQTDNVYNWGVFDFSAPHFAWKFAKGRLDYMLAVENYRSFLKTYFYEERYVISQKVNLNPEETHKLLVLINDNLKPENLRYRYDFLYDNCSTRIRDLFEKTIGPTLLYPPVELKKPPTFRKLIAKYQNPFPWLKFGVDLLLGAPVDKVALFRERMFLPVEMQEELSEAVVNRSGKMIPLLQNPVTVLDFGVPVVKHKLLTTPWIVFSAAMILVIVLSSLIKSRQGNRIMDLVIWFVYAILASMMIFFNFFTDHLQLRWNLNIIWLNPFIIICFVMLIINRKGLSWFRLVFYFAAGFAVLQFILPQYFNVAIIPLIAILLFRSSIRGNFDWNPLTLPVDDEGNL
ncbi:MAG TPA: DUF4105 domain-containing protein [Bacteroidales bacterium]|nr:DUF4105 domain-containing protein [Bacteroidales bacterium]